MNKCKFGSQRCLCQTCEDPCNNGLDCWECEKEGKAVHDIYVCTGHKGVASWDKEWPWNKEEHGDEK